MSARAIRIGEPARNDTRETMIWIPGGTFRMGSNKHYPEEATVHRPLGNCASEKNWSRLIAALTMEIDVGSYVSDRG